VVFGSLGAFGAIRDGWLRPAAGFAGFGVV